MSRITFLILTALVLLPFSTNAAVTPQIAAGESHTVALKSDGTVWAWGYNGYGQLGDNSTTQRLTPVQVNGLSGVTAIAAGATHTVALKSDGTVWAWGWNVNGQLGDNSVTQRLLPVQVSGLSGVTAIAAGQYHTVALKSDGTVWAWGYNLHGQLGDNSATSRLTPVQVSGLSGVTAITAGQYHTVALKSDGTVWAWGYNGYGQLGDNSATVRLTPVQVSGLSGVTAIAAGQYHTMALKSDGTVWAWGYNIQGQLGDNSTTVRLTPVQVSGLSGATAIAAGQYHNVALKSDGTVWAWGGNGYGQLGDNSTSQRLTPVQVNGLSGVTAIAAGQYHSVALKSDGTVWAWGKNANGQLGDNTSGTYRLTPVLVNGLNEVTAIVAGKYHTVAMKSDGTVWAWGMNANGQLGDNTSGTDRLTPVQVSGLSGVTAIAAGVYHTIALKSDGTVWAWGNNSQGQLGDNSPTQRLTPVQVSGLSGVTAIAAGVFHTLALKSDGTVWAWGNNGNGQLGDNSTTQRLTPVQVSGLSGVTAITAGAYHTIALKSDGTVWAWGDNFLGQLGDNSTTQRLTPVQVSGLSGGTAIAAGQYHTVALKSDGTVWAWGANADGQLGDNSTTLRLTPVQESGLSGGTAIAAGQFHTVALKSDGTVWAWGDNSQGQLGDNTSGTDRLTPVQVNGLSGVTAIAAGASHTVALKSDRSVAAWGDNLNGQLGDPKDANAHPALINLDVTPPETTTDLPEGNYAGSQTVYLSCSDSFSGCSGTWYTTDGSNPTTASPSYSGGITINQTTILKYFSKDTAGNYEAIQSLTYTLPGKFSLGLAVSGSGTVRSTPAPDISCNGGCGQIYDQGTVVTLTAMPVPGNNFVGWGGNCQGTGTCQVTMNETINVTATFADITPPDTIISSSSSSTSGESFSFYFNSMEGDSTFECKLNGGSWNSCTSPYANSIVYAMCTTCRTDTPMSFSVRAKDPAGNYDPTPASFNWVASHSFTAPFNSVLDGGMVQLRATDINGTISFTRPVSFTLKGGYSSDYLSQTGISTIRGTVTITAGTVTMENIVIAP